MFVDAIKRVAALNVCLNSIMCKRYLKGFYVIAFVYSFDKDAESKPDVAFFVTLLLKIPSLFLY